VRASVLVCMRVYVWTEEGSDGEKRTESGRDKEARRGASEQAMREGGGDRTSWRAKE
jgi:hypothetical protein